MNESVNSLALVTVIMKAWKKYSTLVCSILTCVLLGEFVCFSEAQLPVIITTPPENTTVCRGSDVTISCGYVTATVLPVTWIINGASLTQEQVVDSPLYQLNNANTFMGVVSLTVFSINVTTTIQCVVLSTPNTTTSTRGTVTVISELTPIMVTANVDVKVNPIVIKVSWQTTGCAANIIMYNITVMDQYSPAIVTVPANMSSAEISQFPYNGTSIVANREYTITVSAISDQGTSYPSDPVVINTYILRNCKVTSPSVGTIRVSCDSSHQIQVSIVCVHGCDKLSVTSNGYSPLTVMGLDPGKRYTVFINLFDGDQVGLNDERATQTITVISTTPITSSSSSSSLSLTTTMTPAKTSSLSSTVTIVMPIITATSLTATPSLSISMTSSSGSKTPSASLPLPPDSIDSDSGSSSGGSSIGAIAGGVIGGIVVVIIIIIIIIVICYIIFYKNKSKESTYDDTRNLKSPPGTGGTRASEGDTNVTTDNNAQYDKVVYAAPAQTVNIPHQAAASGEQYAVSTKAVNKTSEKQQQLQHVDALDTTKDLQGVTYADLHELPSTDSGNRQLPNPYPGYAELLM